MKKEAQESISLIIASNHEIIREGLRTIISQSHDLQVVGSTTTVPETLRLVGELQPSVLLMDPHLPGGDGMRAIHLMRGEWPQVAIVILTTNHHEETMLHALQAGAHGYLELHTSSNTLLHTIRTAARHEIVLQTEHITCLLTRVTPSESTSQTFTIHGNEELGLTAREREVLQHVAHGEMNKEIAARLSISEPTVKSHLANIFFKLGVDSRASAVAVALAKQILPV
ncbi:MAG TPA: response regulator transcription factor [Ktedonobacteraceae bacterium]|nr:response regulator transcription factor [Ktedonobacteraceae bacterium]